MKHPCDTIQALLSAYVDGELNSKQTAMVSNHLQQCSACQQEYQAMMDVKAQLAHIPNKPLPDGFAQSLHVKLAEEALKQPNRKKKFVGYLKPYSAMAAGLIFALLAGTGYYQQFRNIQDDFSTTAYVNDATLEQPEPSPTSHDNQSTDVAVPTQEPLATEPPRQTQQPQAPKYSGNKPAAVSEAPQGKGTAPIDEQQPAPQQEDSGTKQSAPQEDVPREQPDTELTTANEQAMLFSKSQESADIEDSLPDQLESSPSVASSSAPAGGGSARSTASYKQYTLNLGGNAEFLDYIKQQYTLLPDGENFVLSLDNSQLNDFIAKAAGADVSIQFDGEQEQLTANRCVIVP